MTDKPELAGQLKQVASASSASSSTANGGGDDGVNVHLGPPVLLLAAEPATTNEDDKAGGSGKPRAVGSTADGDLEKALELDGDVKLTRDESADERAARLEREERESRYLHGFRLATVLYVFPFHLALLNEIWASAAWEGDEGLASRFRDTWFDSPSNPGSNMLALDRLLPAVADVDMKAGPRAKKRDS